MAELLPIEVLAVTQVRLAARLSQVTPLRQRFAEFLQQQGVSEEGRSAWELVFAEAVNNALLHGCGLKPSEGEEESAAPASVRPASGLAALGGEAALVTVRWWRDRDRIILEVEDPSRGPPLERLANIALPDDPLATGGRGLFLMQSLTDVMEHRTGPQGHTVRLARVAPEILYQPETNPELEAAMGELSVAYEGLELTGALLRHLVTARPLGEMLADIVQRLRQTHDFEFLGCWLLEPQLFDCDPRLEAAPGVSSGAKLNHRQVQLARRGTEVVWTTPAEAPPGAHGSWAQGAVLPIAQHDQYFGALVAARLGRDRPLKGLDLSTLRTVVNIVGEACATALLRHTRDQEQRALGEWALATNLQRALIPLRPPPQSAEWEVLLDRRSALEVSGDHALARLDQRGRLLLAVADVMGKGGTAAMLAVVFRALVENRNFDALPLDEAVTLLNRDFIELLSGQVMFVTAAFARIDPRAREAQILNAGHCPVLLVRNGMVETEIQASGPPLGVFGDTVYEVRHIPLQRGDRYLLVTDGCYEWETPDGQFGWERLRQLVEQTALGPAEEFWQQLQVAQGSLQTTSDDQTVLYFCRR